MTIPRHSMSNDLSMPCLLHHVSIKSLRSLIIVDLAFFHEILLVFPCSETLVNDYIILLCYVQRSVSLCFPSLSLFSKPEPALLLG